MLRQAAVEVKKAGCADLPSAYHVDDMVKWIIVVLVLLVPTAVLAYGYWFNATHGAFYATVIDVSDREHPRAAVALELSFLDSNGTVLAKAQTLDASGTIYLSSPAAYSCHSVELRAPFSLEARQEWDRCFEGQSRWLPAWIRKVRFVDLQSGACGIYKMPVVLSEHPDTWWLWWVPMRHIGGKPYTSFSLTILFDQDRCIPTN
jgi:hypothetical protein